jgi:hypothetical protein
MRDVKVLVTLRVEDADENIPIAIPESQDAAVEAVENAVRAAHEMGFSHALADNLCIGFVDAVLYEEDEDEDDPDD